MSVDRLLSTNYAKRKPVILTVDDDPNNLSVVRDCLVECNYTILVAEDGESAVQRADYARPDLILLDVMMPGIDGYETCRRLKMLESTKEIPVIFMTALAETGHKVKGLEVGAVDYVTKPFQREELLARISVHLQNRDLTMQLREMNESLEARVEERTAELAQTINALHEEIIERKRGEEERVRLATAIEQAVEVIFMADADWKFTYVNPAFERISGFDRDEVLGSDTAILRGNPQKDEYYEQVRKLLSQENVWSGQVTTRKKDGSLFEAETTISTVRDSKGEIINYVFILRDITHELKLEQELRQSQKMEAIGTLAGGIAHDFNNILTGIIGYTDMAQANLGNGDLATRYLERAQEASLRARDLVSRILAFSHKCEPERKPVHLAGIIEEVLLLLRSSLPSTIEIHQQNNTSLEEDLVFADSTQIHQVLMNLATNAAHAMRDQGGTLDISLSKVDADTALKAETPDLPAGSYIQLTVSDTGHGMEPHIRERIFDPYFTTKKVGEGTGMGLSVVHGIIKNHGGEIIVRSKPGEGSSFHILLPCLARECAQPHSILERPIGGTERILFVDDEVMLAELGQVLLESLGYNVTVAMGSREAMNVFRADPDAFDLVITDMTMPGATGKELARELMSIRKDLPIILCTGFSEQIDEQQARDAGIKGYIMKPYTTMILDKEIRALMEGY